MLPTQTTLFAVRFGRFIRAGREAKGWTQDETSQKLQISLPYYGMIERGQRKVDLELAMQICVCLGLDIQDFILSYRG